MRDREDAGTVRAHLRGVRCPDALRTREVAAEFAACVAEGRADVCAELLAAGCDAGGGSDGVDGGVADDGITPLHVAAAFNSLPLVKVRKALLIP